MQFGRMFQSTLKLCKFVERSDFIFSINVIYIVIIHAQDPQGRTRLSVVFKDIEIGVTKESAPNGYIMVKYAGFFYPFAEKAPTGRLALQPLRAGIADVMTKLDLSGPIEEKEKPDFVTKWAGYFNCAFSKCRTTVMVPKVYETVAATLKAGELQILTGVLVHLDRHECTINLLPYPKSWETVDGIY